MPDGRESQSRVTATAVTAGSTVVSVVGDVDEDEAREVVVRLNEVCEPGSTVAVDLSGVGFFGSRGLSALLACQRIGREREARVHVVVGPTQRFLTRTLTITGIAGELAVFDSVPAALAEQE